MGPSPSNHLMWVEQSLGENLQSWETNDGDVYTLIPGTHPLQKVRLDTKAGGQEAEEGGGVDGWRRLNRYQPRRLQGWDQHFSMGHQKRDFAPLVTPLPTSSFYVLWQPIHIHWSLWIFAVCEHVSKKETEVKSGILVESSSENWGRMPPTLR